MIKSLSFTTYNKLKRKGDSNDEKNDVNRSCDYSGDYQFDGNHQEEKEDALQTSPELKLNQSYRVSFKNGVYTNPERTELYNVYEPNKVLKFIPTSNGYYEASIYIAERNQHMTV